MSEERSMYQYHPEHGITSGFHIRGTRELRKLSIPELSERSGISVATIDAAESNTAKLSTEEIEKIAIALNCHPSGMAFPNWDSIPYKPRRITVEGKAIINNVVMGRKLIISLDGEFGLTIGFAPRKSIHVCTFNRAMSTRMGPASNINRKIEYNISGNNIGTLSDNYTNGSEFDCDNRVIKSIEICISYFSKFVEYKIHGIATTKDGDVQKGRPADSPEGDWEFSAEFFIPAELMGQYSGMYPSAEAIFLDNMSKIDGPAPKA